MPNTVFIYALKCPNTGRPRYIGKTINPKRRLLEHLRIKSSNHRANWIRFLLASGQQPVLEILDEVDETLWPQWEVAYIQHFREQGFDLVNETPGGEGCLEHSQEALEKMSAARVGDKNPLFGKRHSLETRAKMSAAQSGENHYMFGKHPSEETRARLSASRTGEKNPNFGKRRSEETCAKISAANTGKSFSAEHCAKLSAAHQGNKASSETRTKMRLAQKARRLKEKLCQQKS